MGNLILLVVVIVQLCAAFCGGLEFHSLDVEYLPSKTRMTTSLHLQNCKLGRLQNTVPIVWPKLEEVYFKSVRMQQQPWTQLQGAIHLNTLHVADFSMQETDHIGEDFRSGISPTLKYLTLEKVKVRRLEAGCMSRLVNLVLLNIADVPLRKLPRSALPTRMPDLHTFILGSTEIDIIEKNFFNEMPNLVNVLFVNNKFTTLPAELFSPIKHNSLNQLLIKNNPLECNCGLLWLQKSYDVPTTTNVYVTCYDKLKHKYKEVMMLKETEYCN